MLDKRSYIRDMRSARFGLSRRIRLRTRTTSSSAVASVDPLNREAPQPSTDTLTYISGQFVLQKTDQQYGDAGAIQNERATVYFHPMYKSLVEKSYSMYIGGTMKEWKRVSPVTYDDSRVSLKVLVEASQ